MGQEGAAWRPDNSYMLGMGSDTLLNGHCTWYLFGPTQLR